MQHGPFAILYHWGHTWSFTENVWSNSFLGRRDQKAEIPMMEWRLLKFSWNAKANKAYWKGRSPKSACQEKLSELTVSERSTSLLFLRFKEMSSIEYKESKNFLFFNFWMNIQLFLFLLFWICCDILT